MPLEIYRRRCRQALGRGKLSIWSLLKTCVLSQAEASQSFRWGECSSISQGAKWDLPHLDSESPISFFGISNCSKSPST